MRPRRAYYIGPAAQRIGAWPAVCACSGTGRARARRSPWRLARRGRDASVCPPRSRSARGC